MKNKRKLKIVFSVVLQDAGEATRAIEIGNGIREYCPNNVELEIIFLSRGSSFEKKVLENGFKIFTCKPKLPGKGFHDDYRTTSVNIIGDKNLAREILKGEIEALEELRPDIVLYGFWPIASLGARMTDEKIKRISFLPIPFQRDLFGSSLMTDIPDMLKPLTYLPLKIRKAIMKKIPKRLKLKAPLLKQSNIIEALKDLPWKGDSINDIFDMLKADHTIVNDLKEFYYEKKVPPNFEIVGPLYAPAVVTAISDKKIVKIFNRENNKINIFCTLGSSGKKQYLFEVIKALKDKKQEWNAVVLAPRAVCPINEVIELANGNPNIYITDAFVPAPLVNALADIVISHGGQGTVQTAIACGTPIVGYAMQPEQQINLDNIVSQGCGVRIPIHRWKSMNIQRGVERILKKPSYKRNMKALQDVLRKTDGKRNAALSIWSYLQKIKVC